MSSAPLAGVRVLDLTRVLAGPYASYQLALLGADVIKVESLEGDDMRYGTRANDWEKRGLAAPWVAVNGNKRSITMDLKQPRAIEAIRRMVPKVDVVMENFRPGVMDKLGIGYEELKKLNPRLIYAAVSGFGQVGPDRATAAFDGMIQAMSGLMSITGEPGRGPMRVGIAISDLSAGLYCAYGILLALLERERGGTPRGSLDLRQLHLLDLLLAGVRLPGLRRLRPEAVDEALHLLDLLLGARDLGGALRRGQRLRRLERVVVRARLPEVVRGAERRLVDEVPDDLAARGVAAREEGDELLLGGERPGIKVGVLPTPHLGKEREEGEDERDPVLAGGEDERIHRA